MVRIWLFLIGNFLFFMPIFLSVYSFFDFKEEKLYFNLKVFWVKIICGCAFISGDNVIIYLNYKKAVFLKLSDTLKKQKKFFKAKPYSILAFKTKTIIPLNNEFYIFFAALQFALNKTVLPIIKNEKNFLRIKNDILFSKKRKEGLIFLKAFATMNLFSINMFLTKKIMEKLIYAKRKE